MKAAVLGGGFGLYGYVPALAELGHVPVLAEKYRATLAARPELRRYMEAVEWVADEAAQLADCEMAIVARPPAEQVRAVHDILAHTGITHLLLEKPLAADAETSRLLLSRVGTDGRRVRIGYTFRLTPWGRRLRMQGGGVREIAWTFMAHHYANGLANWKRDSAEGGGALAFYGIHVLALLAELGYDRVAAARLEMAGPGDVAAWTAEFTGQGLVPCRAKVDSRAGVTAFMVKDAAGGVTELKEPFAEKAADMRPVEGQDGRVPLLVELLRDLCGDTELCYSWYDTTNDLWQQVETVAKARG